MTYFSNDEYQTLASDLIKDIFYNSTSFRGKISTLRQYAEIVVRKILDVDPQEEITLGKREIKYQINMLMNHEMVENAVNKIRNMGNKATHTQYRAEITEEEFNIAIDGLFDLLSYLLISYFEKYKFGTNNNIMFAFSILPPIIRYKVLAFLYKKYPDNISIIDKLVIATIKACGAETAKNWVEEHKEALLQLNTYSEKLNDNLDPNFSFLFEIIKANAPENMYKLCIDKIKDIENGILSFGSLYSDFESALPYYKKDGRVQGTSSEIEEFNDIMDFLYMGRKERKRLCSGLNDSMVLLDCIE